MQIRHAKPKDLEKIVRLLYQVGMVHHLGRPDLFKEGRKYTDPEILEIMENPKTPILVAVDEADEVLGYAFCVFKQELNNHILTDIKTLYIDDLCVFEHLRGQGVGHFIYNGVVAFARESGCYNVTLNVWSLNPTAQKFYESCGLKPQKIGMEALV